MNLTDAAKAAIINLQKQYPKSRSALIPALHLAQSECGYLPLSIQKEVAELFDIDASEVHSVVTFYDMFHEKPVGKHVIHVCKNVSCMLRGGDEVLKGLCSRLKIAAGETTADGEFTIIASECLGACDRAPMAIVDDQVVGPIDIHNLEQLIEEAEQGSGHPSPVKFGDKVATHG